jgi:hypothetical protein
VAVFLALVVIGLWSVAEPLARIFSPYLYKRDFLQQYVQVRAIADGQDPLRSVSDLAPRYAGVATDIFPHPSPHPPSDAILFFAPYAWLDFKTASIAWFCFQVVCLAASIYLLGRALGRRPSAPLLAISTISAIGWYPIREDLGWGNVTLVLLPLVVGSWLAAKHERDGLAGALLGASLLIKPVAWPVLLAFALHRRWQGLRGTVGIGSIGVLVSGATIGFDRLVAYATKVLPGVTGLYQAVYLNLSLSAQAWHLLSGGTTTPTADGLGPIVALPVLPAEPAAPIGSLAAPALALILGVLTMRRLRSLPWSIALMVCLSVVITPLSWYYDVVLLLLPLALVVDRAIVRRWLGWPSLLALAGTSILLLTPWPLIEGTLVFQASHRSMPTMDHPLSRLASAIFMGPTLMVVGFAVVIAIVGRSDLSAQPGKAR